MGKPGKTRGDEGGGLPVCDVLCDASLDFIMSAQRTRKLVLSHTDEGGEKMEVGEEDS